MMSNGFNSNVRASLGIQTDAAAVEGPAAAMLKVSHDLVGVGTRLDPTLENANTMGGNDFKLGA